MKKMLKKTTVSNAYGEMDYAVSDSKDSGASTSRAARNRMYGFNLPQDATNDIDEERLNVSLLGVGFAQHTTSHAVTHVFRASSKGKKALWIILSVVTIVVLALHLAYLIDNFLKFEVTTTIMDEEVTNFTFPAVTVCNQNMVRASQLNDFLLDLITQARAKKPSEKVQYELLDSFIEKFASLELEQRHELGHQAADLILQCNFNGHDCGPEDFFTTYNPYYGNCFTFNSAMGTEVTSDKAVIKRSGPRFGLKLMLNIQQYQYVSYLTESSGARVVVHDRNVMPFPEQSGLNVAPNALVEIALKKMNYARATGLYGSCVEDGKSADEFETVPNAYKIEYSQIKYSKTACHNTCLQKETVTRCKCSIADVPYNETLFADDADVPEVDQTCSSDHQECVEQVYDEFADGDLKCSQCKDPCRETTYRSQATTTTWPAPSYMTELIQILKDEHNNTLAELQSAYELQSLDVAVKENLMKINIFFENMMQTNTTQTPAYNAFQFVADLGGVFGLWIGWSMLTIFEFFEFASDLVAYCCIKRKHRSNKTHPLRVKVRESRDNLTERNRTDQYAL